MKEAASWVANAPKKGGVEWRRLASMNSRFRHVPPCPGEEVEELSFEELLEQEKAFFKLQNKTSFPREVRKSKKTR